MYKQLEQTQIAFCPQQLRQMYWKINSRVILLYKVNLPDQKQNKQKNNITHNKGLAHVLNTTHVWTSTDRVGQYSNMYTY